MNKPITTQSNQLSDLEKLRENTLLQLKIINFFVLFLMFQLIYL